ncbi:MAG TPA: DUF4188 domain-containing protein, partial [Roseiflexaceae bacterium]
SHDHAHWPAWVAFNKRVRVTSGDVGIWHETYRIAPGQYEAIYGSMPAFGLGQAGRLVPASGRRDTAHGRMVSTGRPTGAADELAPQTEQVAGPGVV